MLLRTLGVFGLYDDSQAPVLGPSKPLALLAYLHATPGRAVARDHLLHMFWSDVDESAARHTLRQTSYYLRQHLGDEVISTSGGTVQLLSKLRSDRTDFMDAVDAGDVEKAVDEYGGDYLAGFYSPGALEFEHWVDAERQRLRLLFLRAAESLARSHLRSGRFRLTRELAERMRQTDPLDETAWRLKLEAALAAGDYVHALADAQQCETLLSAEHRTPDPATRAVLRRARRESNGDSDRPEPGKLAAELVGRAREFGVLVSGFKQSAHGTARTIHLVASAGFGKTCLLTDFARYLTADGRAVAYARALPVDRDLPWTYAVEMVRRVAALPGASGIAPASAAILVSLDPSLSALWPGVVPAAPADEGKLRHRVSAIEELIRAVAEAQPFALLLDDFHWADSASRDLYSRLAARLTDVPVLFVCAYRPNTVSLAVQPLDQIDLKPLSPEEVEALLTSLGTPPSPAWLRDLGERFHVATGGSPLLTLETLRFALDTSCLSLEEGRWASSDAAALADLLETGSALTRRIAQLSAAQRRLVLLIALAGGPVATQTLLLADGGDSGDFRDRLHLLERFGLVTQADGAWIGAHDEISDRTASLAPIEARQQAHRALAVGLVRETPSVASMRQAAWHFDKAGSDAELSGVATSWLSVARASGDRRSATAIIADLLGCAATEARVAALANRLPLSLRYASHKRYLLSALAAALLLVTFGLTEIVSAGRDDLVLVATADRDDAGSWRFKARALTARDMTSGVIDRRSFGRIVADGLDRPYAALRPGGRGEAATTRSFPDSGGEDVALVKPGTALISRLTSARGDDVVGSWSPDGRKLAIQTDRWSDRSMSDVAIIDMSSPEAAPFRVTNGRDSRDTQPFWSPDGSRIAFLRTRGSSAFSQTAAAQFCVVSIDGKKERCFDIPSMVALNIVGWANAIEFVGRLADSTRTQRIEVISASDGRHRELAESGGAHFTSHAAGWVACFCRRSAVEPFQTLVFSVDAPERAIRFADLDAPPQLMLLPVTTSATYLDRMEIGGAARSLPADGESRLNIAGWDVAGRPVQPLEVRWSVDDTTIARIDSTGTIRPLSHGSVRVTATTGGWRTAAARAVFAPSHVEAIVEEPWDSTFTQRWAPFGEPRPRRVRVLAGDALATSGDSTFSSGVYLRAPLPTSDGIGLELDVFTPISSSDWQNIQVYILGSATKALAAWDHRTGNIPLAEQEWRACGIAYPAGQRVDLLHWSAHLTSQQVPVPPRMRNGALTRLRIQTFPDGRCGLALNGNAIAVSDYPTALGDSAMVLIHGYSHRTVIAVGRTAVWLGVRRDIDWTRVALDPLK